MALRAKSCSTSKGRRRLIKTRGAVRASAFRQAPGLTAKDFGLNWNAALEAGGLLVGEEVTITLDVEFVQA